MFVFTGLFHFFLVLELSFFQPSAGNNVWSEVVGGKNSEEIPRVQYEMTAPNNLSFDNNTWSEILGVKSFEGILRIQQNTIGSLNGLSSRIYVIGPGGGGGPYRIHSFGR